jgi:hypothetical protein
MVFAGIDRTLLATTILTWKALEHSGAYDVGIEYAKTMGYKMSQSAKHPHNVTE